MKVTSKDQKQFEKHLSRPVFSFTKDILREFDNAKVYLVGGAVRDILLSIKEITDYDFVVCNVEAKKLESFLKERGNVNLVGKNFGVFKFNPENAPENFDAIDIALPRTEHAYQTGGYKDFDIQSDPNLPIEADLERRDFTINALAYDIDKKEIIDEHGGLEDITEKSIRTVGEASIRFHEDFSRMLRGIRFACQLNFEIESDTMIAIKEHMASINKTSNKEYIVPRETIAKELLKTFYAAPRRALEMLDEASALQELMPELLTMKGCEQPANFHTEGDVWQHTSLALELLESKAFKKKYNPEGKTAAEYKASPLTIMGVLFHDLGKPYTIQTPEKDGTDRIRFTNHESVGADLAKKICQRLKLSSPHKYGFDIDDLHWMVKHHLIAVHPNVENMKNTTIEKYFFSKNKPGKELLEVLYIDAMATVPEDSKPDLSALKVLEKRISEIEKLREASKAKRIPALLSGDEIMKMLQIKPSKMVGEILDDLREEQLKQTIKTRKEAKIYLLEKYKTTQ